MERVRNPFQYGAELKSAQIVNRRQEPALIVERIEEGPVATVVFADIVTIPAQGSRPYRAVNSVKYRLGSSTRPR